jgi:hypothetical protein
MRTSLQALAQRPAAPDSIATWVVLFLAVLCFSPPTGVWLDGEQYYLWLAKQWVGESVPPQSALLDGMPHAYIFLSIAGTLLELFGDAVGQIILHVLVAAAYTFAISRLAFVLRLRLLEIVLVLCAFMALGQSLFAGEWIFKAVEPKSFAYPLVLLATADLLQKRLVRAAVLLALATHMHLLVGGFWTVILGVAALVVHRSLRPMLVPLAIYVAATLPLAIILMMSGYVGAGADAPGGPSAAWITTYVRMPHHATPWIDRYTVLTWLPSILALIGMTAISARMQRWLQDEVAARLSIVVFIGGCFLLSMLAATGIDSSGTVGATTPFRPSSLVLLYFLVLVALLLQTFPEPGRSRLAISATVLLAALIAPTVALEAARPIRDERRARAEFSELASFAARTPADTTFLVWPDLEPSLYWFERTAQRRMLIVRKFIPARAAGVQEWYRRRMFQDQLFARGCPLADGYRVDVLVMPPQLATQFKGCSKVVVKDDRYVVLDLRASTAAPASTSSALSSWRLLGA